MQFTTVSLDRTITHPPACTDLMIFIASHTPMVPVPRTTVHTSDTVFH